MDPTDILMAGTREVAVGEVQEVQELVPVAGTKVVAMAVRDTVSCLTC